MTHGGTDEERAATRAGTVLAEGIETDPTGHVGQWGDVTIGGLLGSFRDTSEPAAAWVWPQPA